jgi:hypothetical protein
MTKTKYQVKYLGNNMGYDTVEQIHPFQYRKENPEAILLKLNMNMIR